MKKLLRSHRVTQREKCRYSELFRSVFSRIRTEYGEKRSISLYSARMRENAELNNYMNTYHAVSSLVLGLKFLQFQLQKGNFLLYSYSKVTGLTNYELRISNFDNVMVFSCSEN